MLFYVAQKSSRLFFKPSNTYLRVIVRENQADDERWGSADSDHSFAVRYPYPTDNQNNILFLIALIGFEYDHPL